ncbi:hypothetical protein L6R29_18325 [Myxococcota bacterium]|nr:hypothetical protein [Myxococcota bacterium]
MELLPPNAKKSLEVSELIEAESVKEDTFAFYIDALQETASLPIEDVQKVQDLFDEEPTPYLIDAVKEYNRRVIASSLGQTVLRHGR